MRSTSQLAIGIIGTGRMGTAAANLARERGHEIRFELGSSQNEGGLALTESLLANVDVVVEFTRPETAVANIRRCLHSGTSVVTGTTGWHTPEIEEDLKGIANFRGAALLAAPNFALGMALFRQVVKRAAELIASEDQFDLWIEENHHSGKVDAPSGTALDLAAEVLDVIPRKKRLRPDSSDLPADEAELVVSSVRSGYEPGLHRVMIDAPDETIRLTHQTRSRRVFATGAVRAAEWVAGRTGLYSLADLFVLEEQTQ